MGRARHHRTADRVTESSMVSVFLQDLQSLFPDRVSFYSRSPQLRMHSVMTREQAASAQEGSTALAVWLHAAWTCIVASADTTPRKTRITLEVCTHGSEVGWEMVRERQNACLWQW